MVESCASSGQGSQNLPIQNPLLANATVTDRRDEGKTATTRLVEGKAKLMQAPPRRPGKVPLEKGYSQIEWMRLQRTSKDLAGKLISKKCCTSVLPLFLQCKARRIVRAVGLGGGIRKNITLEEVSRHSSQDDAWTILRGKVYNITPYMKFHPGGVSQLERGAGNDCTALFLKYHAWVNAEMMLEKCLVGFLAKEEAASNSTVI